MAALGALKSLKVEFGNMSRSGKIKTIILAAFIVALIAYQSIGVALTFTFFAAIIWRVRVKEITPEKKRSFALCMLFLAMFFLFGRSLEFLDYAYEEGHVIVFYTWLRAFYEFLFGSSYYSGGSDYIAINGYGLSAISFLFFCMDFKR